MASGDELGQGLASALYPERSTGDEPDSLGDVRMAASVRFLGEMGRFADELAERGRVLPGIALNTCGSDDAVAQARWRAMLRGT